jgi:hypothetical protein
MGYVTSAEVIDLRQGFWVDILLERTDELSPSAEIAIA